MLSARKYRLFNMKFLLIFVFLFAGAVADYRTKARKALEDPELFEGDIRGYPEGYDRNAIIGENYRWPNGVVPYVIADYLEQLRFLFERGMKNFTDHTCIKFVRRTNETDYIKIYADGHKCNSHVGRQGGMQYVSLSDYCWFDGTVVHELGHAIGLFHEHNRYDRDDYIKIYFDKVDPKSLFNFAKQTPATNVIFNSFDYDSIMIYGNKAFAKVEGDITMVAKNGHKLLETYEKTGLTASDIERINKLYKCKPKA